jgi:fibronectin type 3 domain-containing protein
LTANLQFDPTTAGAATGTLTVTSTSSASGTTAISLSGTGTTYQVSLTWDAPASSADPVAGYNIYRIPSGGTTPELVNSSATTQTAYTDNTVQAGTTYEYTVESVDASGVTSVPSNTASVTIP